ncbi:unnamed protein product, partial [Mesorhabditis belari]|uniref:Secreted protein n=1 Tax=Mesorhabditis belari TaxID=2138241 RepID=A0AAF3J5A4_9BILA
MYGFAYLLLISVATVLGNRLVEIDCDILSVCGQDLQCGEQLAERLQISDCLATQQQQQLDKRSFYSDKRGPQSIRRILLQRTRI